VLLLGRFMQDVERERARLRRVVLWLGERDALVSIASMRAERPDARLPELVPGSRRIAAADLAHPAVAHAIGNDLALDAGLLLTGSNMSGKSTFLRAIAINAICAQSIHTTFGRWRAGLFRVFAVMRVADETAEGMSTYAVEVAAIGKLVDAVDPSGAGDAVSTPPALFVLDEPFRGTNPALRVPIVVSTLDYLGARDVAIAATHDLEVADQVDAGFARGYFCEPDDATGAFDRKLRPGVAPTSNALALLVRAGYPGAIVAAVERRIAGVAASLAGATRPIATASTSR
jgi:DNA mismatch repair ATPase MutS